MPKRSKRHLLPEHRINRAIHAIVGRLLDTIEIRDQPTKRAMQQLCEVTGLKQDDVHSVVKTMVTRNIARPEYEHGGITRLTLLATYRSQLEAEKQTGAAGSGKSDPKNPPAKEGSMTDSNIDLPEGRKDLVRLVATQGTPCDNGYRLDRPEGESSLAVFVGRRLNATGSAVTQRLSKMESDKQLVRIKGDDGHTVEALEVPRDIIRAVMGQESITGATPPPADETPASQPGSNPPQEDDNQPPANPVDELVADDTGTNDPAPLAQRGLSDEDYNEIALRLMNRVTAVITAGHEATQSSQKTLALEKEVAALQQQTQEQATELLEVVQRQTKSQTRIAELEEEVGGYKNQVGRLEASLSDKDAEVARLTSELVSANKTIQRKHNQIAELEASLEALDKERPQPSATTKVVIGDLLSAGRQ